jgi:hypothetical protein
MYAAAAHTDAHTDAAGWLVHLAEWRMLAGARDVRRDV